jgi:hypothetical protein
MMRAEHRSKAVEPTSRVFNLNQKSAEKYGSSYFYSILGAFLSILVGWRRSFSRNGFCRITPPVIERVGTVSLSRAPPIP